jgi:hypothetical protein
MNEDDGLDLYLPLEESQPLTTWRVVLISSLVALVIGCVPALATSLIVNDKATSGQEAIVKGRVQQTLESCHRNNRIIRSNNKQADYLANLIVNSTRSSKVFEKVYVRLGLPDYKHRLAQAEGQATGIRSRKLPEIDCAALAEKVSKQK